MFQKGIAVGFPIMLGYIPVALTYGVLAIQSGMSLLDLTLMSALVYAGASQFMGVNMIVANATAVEIIVATFVLNFRHFIMSLSFMNEIREQVPLRARAGMSLLLTDETFAVSALHREMSQKKHAVFFYAAIHLSAYLSWIFGSFLGGLLGEIIPEQLSQSMGVALYAMFIGLLVPSVKKEARVGLIAVIAILIIDIVNQIVSSGWANGLGTSIGRDGKG